MARPAIHVSIVSHGHGALVRDLLRDLAQEREADLRVTVTLNVPEPVALDQVARPFPLRVIHNTTPRGFAANHNAAFRSGAGDGFFCVANPDVRIAEGVFPRLVATFAAHPDAAVVAPRVRDHAGRPQNSARKLPAPGRLVRRALGALPPLDYPLGSGRRQADWVAGMLMMLPARVFGELGGFDERFFLYYEDVHLCCRARLLGYDVVLDETTYVTHDGLWHSHRNLRYTRWHLASMARFFMSSAYREVRRREGGPPVRAAWRGAALAAPSDHERP